VNITQPALATARDTEPLTASGQIANDLIGILITHERANRYGHDNILAGAATFLLAFATMTALSAKPPRVPEISQRVKARISLQPDTAAVATIPAIGAATRDIFFAAKAHTAVTAVTGDDLDARFINKFHDRFATIKKPRSRRG
jgi:hypothetical protein